MARRQNQREENETQDVGLTILENLNVSYWTVEEFREMEPKMLKKFALYNGSAVPADAEMKRLIEKNGGFTKVDSGKALQVFLGKESKQTAASKPDTFINTNGGKNHYTPEKVELVTVVGEKKVRANSPIPAEFGETEKYSNVVPLSAFAAQLVEVKKGYWSESSNAKAWIDAFGTTGLDVTKIRLVADTLVKILSSDRAWSNMQPTARASVSGIDKLTFIRRALDRLSYGTYLTLNTMIVCEAFRTFRKDGGGWSEILGADQEHLVDPTMFEEVDPATVPQPYRDMLLKKYPGIFLYRGGWAPMPNLIQDTVSFDTIEGIKAISQQARDVQGSNSSSSSILAMMKDYSGLTDDFGKRLQFHLAGTLAVWSRKKKANIVVESIGDVPALVSSLLHWQSAVHSKRFPGIEFFGEKEEVFPCEFKIVVPSLASYKNLNTVLREHVATSLEPDCVYVYYNPGGMPQPKEKKTQVDYDSASRDIVPEDFRDEEYIMYTAIYGLYPFFKDPRARNRASKQVTWVPWENDAHVYAFCNASTFNGIISTFPDLQLFGYGYRKTGGVLDRTREMICPIDLKKLETQEKWYDHVKQDCVNAMVAFLRPISRYSPISNLPFISKKTAIIVKLAAEDEGGEALGNIQVPAFKAAMSKPYVSKFAKPAAGGTGVQEKIAVPVTNSSAPILPPPQRLPSSSERTIRPTIDGNEVDPMLAAEFGDAEDNLGDLFGREYEAYDEAELKEDESEKKEKVVFKKQPKTAPSEQ